MRLALVAIPLLLIATGCARENETDTTATAPDLPPMAAPDATVGAPAAVNLAQFVERAALTDMFEVEAGKLAQQRARSPQIKAFARQMVNDHTATTAQLKAILAGQTGAPTPPAALDQAHMDKLARLREARADDFDGIYLDQQTEAHEDALNMLQAYAQSGDNAAVKAFAADTAPKVQQHLQMVKDLDDQGADDVKKS